MLNRPPPPDNKHPEVLNPPRGFRGNRGHGTTRFQECDSKKMEIVCFRLYSFLLPILFTYRPAKINFQIKEYRNVRYGSNNQKLRCSWHTRPELIIWEILFKPWPQKALVRGLQNKTFLLVYLQHASSKKQMRVFHSLQKVLCINQWMQCLLFE